MKRIKLERARNRTAFVWVIQYQIQREAFIIWQQRVHRHIARDDEDWDIVDIIINTILCSILISVLASAATHST